MKLEKLKAIVLPEQDVAIFQGFLIKYIGKMEQCTEEALLEATVKTIEVNGASITIKLI